MSLVKRPQLCIFIDFYKKEYKLARALISTLLQNLPADPSTYDLALIYDCAKACDEEGTKGVLSTRPSTIHQLIPYMQTCPNTILRVLSHQSTTSYIHSPSLDPSQYIPHTAVVIVLGPERAVLNPRNGAPELEVIHDERHELRAFILSSFWSLRSIPRFLAEGQTLPRNFPP